MKKLIVCSMLIGFALPSIALAAPKKVQTEQDNCRVVGIKIMRTVDGETVAEYIIRCDVGPNGQLT
jgi:uncharacterized protein YqkB